MKKTFYALIGGIILIVIYLYVVSVLANGISLGGTGTIPNKSQASDGTIQVGVGESVGIQVIRHRWYGTIVETHASQGTLSELRLFNFFSVPSKIGDVEMIWIHLSVFLIVIFIIVLCIFIDVIERGSVEK